MYTNLNDAASIHAGLKAGETKIWYFKDGMSRDLMMGHEWLSKYNKLPNKNDLTATHACLGSVAETDPDEIFMVMQGEHWSPRGEARDLIKNLGLSHTSMCIGDVIQVGDKFLFVDSWGFVQL